MAGMRQFLGTGCATLVPAIRSCADRGKEIASMQSSDAIGYVEAAACRRAAHYRERAVEFRRIAAAEPIGSLRNRLIGVARKYEELAASLATRNRNSPARASSAHRDSNRKKRADEQAL